MRIGPRTEWELSTSWMIYSEWNNTNEIIQLTRKSDKWFDITVMTNTYRFIHYMLKVLCLYSPFHVEYLPKYTKEQEEEKVLFDFMK